MSVAVEKTVSLATIEVECSSASLDSDEKPSQISDSLAERDFRHPYNWSRTRRWTIVAACSLMATMNVMSPSLIVPAAPQILQSFHSRDVLYRTLLVTIWELGEGFSPFFSGPLSEIFGRAPIFHGGNFLGLLCTVAAALSTNISMLVAFRCLTGFFLTSPVIAPAIIGDVIPAENRGLAMAVGQSLSLVAPFVSPIAGSYLNQALGWRWVIWIFAVTIGVVALFSLLVVRETYAPKNLGSTSRQSINNELEPNGLSEKLKSRVSNEELESHSTDSKSRPQATIAKVLVGIMRPLRLLSTSYTLFLITAYNGFAGGTVYLLFTIQTEIMETEYKFSRGAVGLTFIAPSLGIASAIFLYGLTSDRYMQYQKKKSGELRSKHRLAYTIFGSFLMPLALLFVGWTLQYRVQFVAPLVGIALAAVSYILAYIPVTNYLVDAFGDRSASALSASMIMLSIFSALFPLLGPPLFKNLGYGWGNSLLALISALFIPLLLLGIRSTQ